MFNKTQSSFILGERREYDRELTTIHSMIVATAQRFPQAEALSFEDATLTYAALEQDSRELAQLMIDKGLTVGAPVAIITDKCSEFVVGALAALRAGGFYVPIDPEYPDERIALMLQASGAHFCLTHSSCLAKVQGLAAQVDFQFLHDLNAGHEPVANPAALPELTGSDGAYMIFTSGTSGVPKGVLNCHRSVVNLMLWYRDTYQVDPGDSFSQLPSLSFDASIGEIFPALMLGAHVQIFPSLKKLDPAAVVRGCIEKKITFATLSPTYMKLMLAVMEPEQAQSWQSLRWVLLGGEALPYATVQAWQAQFGERVQVVNIYGPTEATVFSTAHPLTFQEDPKGRVVVPIGKPLINESVFIRDADGQCCPLGQAGELCIGGDGLAIGYFGDQEKTEAAFVHHLHEGQTLRLYRTGDKAMLNEQGEIEFLGRLTDQVKIKGYRVELQEVISNLLRHELVNDAFAQALKDANETDALVAYVTTKNNQPLDFETLKTFLAQTLPDFMVPSRYLWIKDELPYTTSGKVDKKQLPEIDWSEASARANYEEPQGEVEQTIAEVWSKVLKIKQVGRQDNFYFMGGDSISALRSVSLLNQQGYTVKASQLLTYPIVQELANRIGTRKTPLRTQSNQKVVGEVPLTPIQHWFFGLDLINRDYHHQSLELEVAQELNPDWVAQAVVQLIQHHDMLRTCFIADLTVKAGVRQRIEDSLPPISIEQHDLSAQDPQRRLENLTALGERLRRQVQLGTAPLMQLAIVRLAEGRTRLIWIMHHAIVDTVSWQILGDDFLEAYAALARGDSYELPDKTTSFQEWSIWQNQRDQQQNQRDQRLALLDYWLPTLQARSSCAKLPIKQDLPTTAGEIQVTRFQINKQLSSRLLEEAIRCFNTTVEDLILVGLYRAYAQWTQTEDVLLDVEWHGRENQTEAGLDLGRTVGWFTTIHPLYCHINATASLSDQIIALKEQRRRMPDHGVSFNQLRLLSAWPEVQAAFAGYQQAEVVFNFSGLINETVGEWEIVPILAMENAPENLNPYRMAVETFLRDGHLVGDIYTSHELVDPEQIEQLGKLWVQEMNEIITYCCNPAHARKTPSDFEMAQLDQEELALLPAETLDVFPLSDLQSAMYFYHEMYLVQVVYRIETAFDHHHLDQTLQQLVQRHPALRTVIRSEGLAQPLQVVLPQAPIQSSWENISSLSEDEKTAFLDSFLRRDRKTGFNLAEAPLFRACALVRDPNCFDLVLSVHHIIHDGWSLSLVMQEFQEIYRACQSGCQTKLSPVRGDFKEFVRFQRSLLADPEERAFWSNKLSGFDLPHLPRDFHRPPSAGPVENEILFEHLGPERTQRLRQFVERRDLTLNDLFLASYVAMLHFLSQNERVILGIITSGRDPQLPDYEAIVGCCVNTLPLTLLVDRKSTLLALTEAVHREMFALGDHLSFPLSGIVELAKPADHKGPFELFETLYNFESQQYVDDPQALGVPTIVGGFETTNYGVTFGFFEEPTDIAYKVTYMPTVYERATIARWIGYFLNLLEATIEHSGSNLDQIDWMGQAERQRLLEGFNQTHTKFPDSSTIQRAIEDHAAITPDETAVVFKTQRLTYRTLNEQANQLAWQLRQLGAGPNQLVGLMVDRTHLMVVGILGILKSGAAYIPIDPTYPENRIEYMLDHSQAQILVTHRNLDTHRETIGNVPDTERLPGRIDFRGQTIDLAAEDCFHGPTENPKHINQASDLAYVIYTSGSTGKPKGVMIEHHNALNFVTGMNQVCDFQPDSRFLALTTICFDIFFLETVLPLINGMCVVVADESEQMDPIQLNALISREKIDVIQATPARMRLIVNQQSEHYDDFSAIRKVLVGGEPFPEELLSDLWRTTDAEIYNVYGPTETTIWSTVKKIPRGGTIDIGQPIANTQIYILDPHRQLLPLGLPGELWIGGEGVGRGYLHRSDLTEERFIDNPFRSGERIYATGDLGRWRADGCLECLGRIDFQVKIRGFRVELGEIEARLLTFASVKEAVATARILNGVQTLCAYYMSVEELDHSELREYLAAELPDYMVPTYLTRVAVMPLSPGGKVNRNALPDPEVQLSERIVVPPSNDNETMMLAIWSEVLGLKEISTTDSFFDLGGHSLRAINLVSRINKSFHSRLSFASVFNYPTIQELAKHISASVPEEDHPFQAAPKASSYPLSYQQERLFAIQSFDPSSTVYNMPAAFELTGCIQPERIEQALAAVIARHGAFRTSFHTQAGLTTQRVAEQVPFKLERTENTCLDAAAKIFIRPFDLGQAPLFRTQLVTLGPDKHGLLLDMHHIISDGASTSILARDFVSAYHQGQIEPTPFHYSDYAVWLKDPAMDRKLATQERYWLSQYQTVPTVLDLPTDFPRPALQSNEGARFTFKAEPGLAERVHALAASSQVTPFILLLAAFKLLLARYSGQDDLVVGIPVAGRGRSEFDNIVGLFVNTVTLRSNPSLQKPMSTFLGEVRQTALDGYAHQEYPFEALIEKIKLNRDLSRNPLFDVMFMQENLGVDLFQMAGLDVQHFPLDLHISRVDLLLTFSSHNPQDLSFGVEYCTKLFQPATMTRFQTHFLVLLESLVSQPDQALGSYNLLCPAERETLLHGFNVPFAAAALPANLPLLLEAQVLQTPSASALELEDRQLDFASFNALTNRLAHLLREMGAGPNCGVGLACTRSMEMVIGLYAILKAGAYYVPIDQDWPLDRAATVIEETGLTWALVETDKAASLIAEASPGSGLQQLRLSDLISPSGRPEPKGRLLEFSSENPSAQASGDDLAYIIFTSGTTGKPKGVLTTNRNLTNLVSFMKGHFYEPGERSSQIASYCFDGSVIELAGVMPSGATLCLCPAAGSMEAVVDYLVEKRLTNLLISPSYLKQVLPFFSPERVAELAQLRKVFSGGEALEVALVQDLQARFQDRLIVTNVYGPTETTVFSTSYQFSPERLAHEHGIARIGTPILNTHLYVLDGSHQLCPVGIEGEIYLSGAGLARGYLNDPEQTQRKFLDSPFVPSQRIYGTGDLGKYHADGTVEILGRKDDQVKIRGFRIEISEVESAIQRFELVREVVVIAREVRGGDKSLVAYLVGEPNLSVSALKASLKTQLPEYMVPSYFVVLEAFPLNQSSKVDRKLLPEPELHISEYVPPRTPMEAEMAQLWEEVLGSGPVGIEDNFFDKGGHSLKAMSLAGLVGRHFGIDLPIKALFQLPTVAQLVEALPSFTSQIFSELKPAEPAAFYPVSSQQRRIYTLQQFDKLSITYNMPAAFRLSWEPNAQAIENAFRQVIGCHEAYRTCFVLLEGQPVQQIEAEVTFNLERWDRPGAEPAKVIEEFIRPFDLTKAPLMRVGLVRLAAADYLLLMDTHHIISDGVSMGILARDFFRAYQGETLTPATLHYKDYAVWQVSSLGREALNRQKGYWLARLVGHLPTLDLPSDFPRPPVQSFEGARARFQIEPKLAEHLRWFCWNEDLTPYMFLMAVTKILLSRISGQEEIVLGSPIAGRDRADLNHLIGMFVNTLVIRSAPEHKTPIRVYLQKLKILALEAFQNQSYPFEDLLEQLNLTRDLSRNPLFDVMFLLQNLDMQDLELDGQRAPFVNFESGIAKFDLSFIFYDNGSSGFALEIEYATRIFAADRIARMGLQLIHLIGTCLEYPDASICELPLLDKSERTTVMETFNQTQQDFGSPLTLDAAFRAKVSQYKDMPALVLADKTLSYGELDRLSNKLAHDLRAKFAVGPEVVVPIICERSFEMVVGIMAILKAGGAYLPISPENPEDRTNFILDDCEARVVLTQSHLLLDVRLIAPLWRIDLSTDPQTMSSGPHMPEVLRHPQNLAYIIYTSGSTGKPKGVTIEHATVFNILSAMQQRYPLGPGDSWLLKTAFTFDVSVTELFGWYFGEGHLVILPPGQEKDPSAIGEVVARHKITHINFVPSMLSVFLAAMTPDLHENLRCLKHIHVAGEAFSLSLHHALEALDLPARIENIYGPTEATIYATWFQMSEMGERRAVPIGQPVSNARAYIFDRYFQPVPIGVPGELCIGGAGLARGYLNRPELTKEKFMPDPFRPDERIYRTGDLVAWSADGQIEYLGRIDHQAKVRGYRIELGEIETLLNEYPLVNEAVVTVRLDEYGTAFLCAYVVGESNLSSTALREHLARSLPDYMVPAHFVALEAMPLNPSGKVDRKALPDPSSVVSSGVVYVGPRNPHEQVVVSLWQDLLGLERVGVHDDFFALGGHSLIAIRLLSRFEQAGYNVGLNDVFRYRTAAELAARMASKQQHQVNQQSLEEGLHQIRSQFQCQAESRTFTIADREIQVLFTDADLSTEGTRQLVQFIGERFSPETLPHYLRPWQHLPSEGQPIEDGRALAKLLDLQTELSPAEELAFFETAFERSKQYAKGILAQPDQTRYAMSPIQLGHLTLTLRPAGGMMVFKDYLDLERFGQAFAELVEQQGLLRSRPERQEGTWVWRELQAPASVALPCLDLSHLDLDHVEDMILKLMGRFFFYDYQYDDGQNLPYNFLLVRQNLREYLLIFTADHIIYDAMSDEIVKNTLLKAYYQGAAEAKQVGESYQAYVDQTLRGPQHASAAELIRTFQLDEYRAALKNLEEIVTRRGRKDLRVFSVDVRLKDQGLTERTPFEVAFSIFIRFVGAYLELENLPLTLVSYGRRYEEHDYFGTIGEFVDQVPVYAPVNNRAFDHVREKLDMAVRHNINFMSLMFDERLRQEWAAVVERFSSEDHTYIESLVRFNFQGKGNPEEMRRMKRFLEERLPIDRPTGAGVVELSGILFEVLYHESTLRISLSTSLDGSLTQLQALLARISDEEVAAS